MTGNVLLDLVISIVGIIILVGLARVMFSDAGPFIDQASAVQRLAFDEPDFSPVAWAVDQTAGVALARNNTNEIAVVFAHGDGLATRRIAAQDAKVQYVQERLTIDRADHTSKSASVAMARDEAQVWLDCLNPEKSNREQAS